ncbi:hypothetical protein [Polyangium fumosum]|nr:hypothetical protein [Polyangium fumosum]
MGSPARKSKPATIEDLLVIPEEERRHVGWRREGVPEAPQEWPVRERVRAEPFEAVELDISELFGEVEDEPIDA